MATDPSKSGEAPDLVDRSGYDKFLDALALISKIATGTALVVLTVIFSWLVFGRYVLNATPTWVEQVSLLLIMLITFVGAAVGIHENTHLGVSYFREFAPERIRKIFMAISHLMLLGFGVLMMWHSYELTVFKWGSEIPLIHIPEGIRTIPITICGALVMLFSIGHLIHQARGIEETSSLDE
ncbi:MAG: TRAP transporter small permease [Hyphomicrobiales bacterium]|nr:TRAP transporter small permease [Hyphomicrobiales bacterium]